MYAICIADMNDDGCNHIVPAGNNTRERVEFRKCRASHGVLLRGNAKKSFRYVPQDASGLNLRYNVGSMQIINDLFVARINGDSLVCYRRKKP